MSDKKGYQWDKPPTCVYKTVFEGGEYKFLRVNLEDGVVKPKRIKAEARLPKANGTSPVPHWWGKTPCRDAEDPRPDCPETAKSVENPYFGMLDNYAVYHMRSDDMSTLSLTTSNEKELGEDELDNEIASLAAYMPFMDDYFTGVSQLGNYNPLSKNVMFRILRSLPEISSKTIYESTHYSLSYCQRLATALRVFIKLTT